MRISFRVNENKDRDIYEALDNVADTTKEVKRLIRRGLMYTPPTTLEKVIKEFNGYSFEENDDLDDKEPIEKRKKKPASGIMPDQIEIEEKESLSPHQEDSSDADKFADEHQTDEPETDDIETDDIEPEYTVDVDKIMSNMVNSF